MANNDIKKYVSLLRLSDFLDNLKNIFLNKSDYVVDSTLSSSSTNPVQNSVINAEFEEIAHAMNIYGLAIDDKANKSDVESEFSAINTSINNIKSGDVVVKEAEHSTSADSATTATSAGSATKATQDASGNVITSTYETKNDAEAKLEEAKSYTDTKTSSLASTTVVDNKISSHNTSTSAHNDIRGLITDLTTRLNALANSTDEDLDQMAEIVAYIKSNKSLIDSITTSKINVTDIVDNLTTSSASKVLSAKQGVAIKELIDALETAVDGKAASSHDHAASNITSGTLSSDRLPTVPITKGGTGATTAAGALTNLGLTATAAELNKMDGVTVTTAELNYVDGVTSNIQNQLDGKQATITGGATTITSSNLTASRALVSDGSGKVAVSAVTSTELGYLDGVTSNVQTQLDGKSSTSHTHSAATTSANGFMSAADKTKLDGIVEATQSSAGLLSAEDKTQLDYGGIPIVTTAGTGAAYTATVDGINALTVGAKITIVPHTASTATQPTLNVNGLGAKAIRQPITYNTSATSVGPIAAWLVANKPVTVQYNGTYWTTIDIPRPSAQYLYGTVPIANGGTGATDAATALANLGAAAPPSSKTVTLSASSWNSSSKTQTVTCSGILADETAQVINVAPAAASMTAAIEAGAYCSGQGADSLTFTCSTVPTAALTFNVSWQACNYVG